MRDITLYLKASVLFAVMICVGCTTERTSYNDLNLQQTPEVWKNDRAWEFNLIDEKKNPLGSFVLQFTDESAKTCSSGVWYKAKLISSNIASLQLENWYGKANLYPSYQVVGRLLIVELNSPICDDNTILRGEVTEAGAQGEIATETMLGSTKLGYFQAKHVP